MTKKGTWKPGESGNPKGKPPGSGEVQKLRTAIATHVPEIIERLVTAAKSGDIQAARLLLERVLPPVKAIEQTEPVNLPAGKAGNGGNSDGAAAGALHIHRLR